MVRLNINGKDHDVDVDPDTPLLWAIRENVGLTGTKYGCGIAQCGACTVHVDGVAMRSCSFPASAAAGKKIITIEGLAQNGMLHTVQKAWVEHDVPQCGYCQSGMIMAVAALLKDKPKPTDADIDARSPTSAGAAPSSKCARRSTPRRTRKGGHHEFRSENQSPLVLHRHRRGRRRPGARPRLRASAPTWSAPRTARRRSASGS